MKTQTADPAYQKLLIILSKSKKSRSTVGSIRQKMTNDEQQILADIPDEALIGIGAEGRIVASYVDQGLVHHWVFNTFGECTYTRY